MGSLKLQSFEDFNTAASKAAKLKLEEEQSAARNDAAEKFKSLLAEFGVTSVKELNEEDRHSFYRKLGAAEISESISVIEEGTRSQIGVIKRNGKIESTYMHYDGYPDHMLPMIKKNYKNGKNVDKLLKGGGGRFLDSIENMEFYGDMQSQTGNIKDIDKFIYDVANDSGAEYVYLWDESTKKWMMADAYDEPRELKPAFEHFIINERFIPSKGNVRDAKKVSKALEMVINEAPALAGDESNYLGAVKYLLMYALEDANFHSYMEPVAKKVGGKIRTIMVQIDSLGGMEMPIGAKTIQKYLDSKYSKLSAAAGWSGIGIVEGVAMYLDNWGFSKVAQAIVDEFNLIYSKEMGLSPGMNEGNAFLAARAKAIEEDAEEFEFNGKKFPVIEGMNDEGEADIDFSGSSKDLKIIKNKFKVEAEEYNSGMVMLKGKKKDILAYLRSDFYGMDEEDIKELYPDLYEDSEVEVKMKKVVSEEDKAEDPGEEVPGGEDSDETEEQFPDDFDATDPAEIGKMTNEDEIEIKVDGDYEIEVEKEDEEESEEEKEGGEDKEDEKTEENMNEAKFVKDFNKDVLDAETKTDIITHYPSAKFFIGKISHFFGELEPNLFFKAYHAKYYKENTGNRIKGDFKITSIYSKKGRNYEYLYYDDDGSTGPTNEAEVKSPEDFKEYAFSVLGKAFGDKFDEEKAQEVVDGLLDKHGDDYGAAVGALQSSLG